MTAGLRITPRMIHDFYKAFSRIPPFGTKGWRLPPANEVSFVVSRTIHLGEHTVERYTRPKKHILALSERKIGHLSTFTGVLAHEMLHAVQEEEETATPGAEHNADFRRRARVVCRVFGFDPKEFV